jgi:hypothetical protein
MCRDTWTVIYHGLELEESKLYFLLEMQQEYVHHTKALYIDETIIGAFARMFSSPHFVCHFVFPSPHSVCVFVCQTASMITQRLSNILVGKFVGLICNIATSLDDHENRQLCWRAWVVYLKGRVWKKRATQGVHLQWPDLQQKGEYYVLFNKQV